MTTSRNFHGRLCAALLLTAAAAAAAQCIAASIERSLPCQLPAMHRGARIHAIPSSHRSPLISATDPRVVDQDYQDQWPTVDRQGLKFFVFLAPNPQFTRN